MDPNALARIIEAALLAAQRPLSLAQIAELFADEPSASHALLLQALDILREGCAERGVELVEVASGYRYQVKTEVQPWVSRLWIERQVKYTRATLETLALIAYRQPITRGEIEQVRGVAVNTNTIKTLEEREWIRVVGHRDVPGKPALFGTTRTFLDYFGLKSLDQLPPLAELGELTELDPELPFEAAPTVAIIDMATDDLAGLAHASSDAEPDDEDEHEHAGSAAEGAAGTTHGQADAPADATPSETGDTAVSLLDPSESNHD